MVIRTIFEVVLVVLVIVGIFNEQKIADFEQKMLKKIRGKKDEEN